MFNGEAGSVAAPQYGRGGGWAEETKMKPSSTTRHGLNSDRGQDVKNGPLHPGIRREESKTKTGKAIVLEGKYSVNGTDPI
jgi:hypothetical protein